MLNTEYVSSIKKNYPVGAVIEVDHMSDSFHPIPKGTRGIVRLVDDIGQIHVNWDNHRSLALVPQEDTFHLCVEDPRNVHVNVGPVGSVDSDLNLSFIYYEFNNLASQSTLASGYYVIEDEDELEPEQLCEIATSILEKDKFKFINLPLVKDSPVWVQFMFKWLYDSENNMAFSSDCEEVQAYFQENENDIKAFINTYNLLEKGAIEIDEGESFNVVFYPMIFHEFNMVDWTPLQDYESQLFSSSSHASDDIDR